MSNNSVKLSDVKTAIKRLRAMEINYFDYYSYILLNNDERWHFVNPMQCKRSFRNPYNLLKFLVLKRLIKNGYKLHPKRCKYNNWYYTFKKK